MNRIVNHEKSISCFGFLRFVHSDTGKNITNRQEPIKFDGLLQPIIVTHSTALNTSLWTPSMHELEVGTIFRNVHRPSVI